MARRRKKKLPALVVVLLIAIYLIYSNFNADVTREFELVDGSIELHMIDVGQADCFLFMTEDGNILFDSGDIETQDEVKDYLDGKGITEIEYAIFTHPDADHIGGAETVLLNFDVKNVIMPVLDDGDIPTTKVYEKMIAAIEADEDINVIAAEPNATYSVGEVKMKILAPNSDNYTRRNDYSVTVRLDFGEASFLMTGDIEKKAEGEILAIYPASELKCDFYKAAHHGAAESNCKELLDRVEPEIIAISCGEGNTYGHPHKETMERFGDTGAEIFRTDIEGTVVFVSDGKTISRTER